MIRIILAIFLVTKTSIIPPEEIHEAVRKGDIQKVGRILGDSGLPAANMKATNKVTPLHIAAARNNSSICSLLLKHGADVNAKTSGGYTALHWAAGKNAVAASKVLIRAKADINAATDEGITPIHWAASRNATNMLELLIQQGAKYNSATISGLTPLHWAIMKEADSAAMMLAYKIDSANTNIFAEAEEEDTGTMAMTTSNTTSALTAPKPILPKARPDSLLNIPIGTDVQLEFVWMKPHGIWVGKYEVTNMQFRRFKPDHKSQRALSFPMDDNNQPAVNVTWKQAQEFCDWLNSNYQAMLPDGFEFRLPASSEWAAAARCGTDRVYPWGDNMPPDYGNYSDLTAKENLPDWKGLAQYNDGHVVTCAVQDSGYNEWGLYGMAGNVWEWCSDWSDDTKKFKVRHGASWDFDPEEALKIDYKGFDRINAGYDNIGFRVTAGPKE